MITENGHFTGGIQSEIDPRDYPFIGAASAPFDWEKGFDIEEKVGVIYPKDQDQSYSCGGQAWSTYSYVLDHTLREEKSAKYIYCQTHVGHGGSAGRTNSIICAKQGDSKESLCLSHPATEAFMTTDDRTPEAIADAATNKVRYYQSVSKNSMEEIAQAIRDNDGVVLGIIGQNNGTWISQFPKSPNQTGEVWAHWVYAGKAVKIGGKRYIGFINSWGISVGKNGWQYVEEEYFINPRGFFEAWTMTADDGAKPVVMPTVRLGSHGDAVKVLQKALGVKVDGIFGPKTLSAAKAYQAAHGLSVDGIVGPKTWALLIN